jgi:hypothetical protein
MDATFRRVNVSVSLSFHESCGKESRSGVVAGLYSGFSGRDALNKRGLAHFLGLVANIQPGSNHGRQNNDNRFETERQMVHFRSSFLPQANQSRK